MEFVKPALLGQKWPYPEMDIASPPSQVALHLRIAAARLNDRGYLEAADRLLRNDPADRSNLQYRR